MMPHVTEASVKGRACTWEEKFACIRSGNALISSFVLSNVYSRMECKAMRWKISGKTARVCEAGRILCVRTPNVRRYFGFVSRSIPSQKHRSVFDKVRDGGKESDAFPTLYHGTQSDARDARWRGMDSMMPSFMDTRPSRAICRSVVRLTGGVHYTPNWRHRTSYLPCSALHAS